MMARSPDRIVAEARSWLGTPYRHQASLKGTGCDCLGLVRGVWRTLYGAEPEALPPYTPDWAEASGEETLAIAGEKHLQRVSLSDCQAGDVLLFRWRAHYPAKHAGILTTAQSFIHAQNGARVSEVPLSSWWQRRISHVFRFPGDTDT